MELEALSRAEWQVMRICWAAGPTDARTLFEASEHESSLLRRLFGEWHLKTFRTNLDRLREKGYLRAEPSTVVAITSRGDDKWAVVDAVAELLGNRDRAIAGIHDAQPKKPFAVFAS